MQKVLKKTCALLVAAVILLSMPIAVQANQEETIAVRSFFESEDVAVDWYGPGQQVTLTVGDKVVTFAIGGQAFTTNNGVITVNVAENRPILTRSATIKITTENLTKSVVVNRDPADVFILQQICKHDK